MITLDDKTCESLVFQLKTCLDFFCTHKKYQSDSAEVITEKTARHNKIESMLDPSVYYHFMAFDKSVYIERKNAKPTPYYYLVCKGFNPEYALTYGNTDLILKFDYYRDCYGHFESFDSAIVAFQNCVRALTDFVQVDLF